MKVNDRELVDGIKRNLGNFHDVEKLELLIGIIEELEISARMATDLAKIVVKDNLKLEKELVEWLEDYMYAKGNLESSGKFKGYIDTMALSSVMDAGDRLVELGLWEKHPDGVGRRWWYRRKVNSNE
jgi:hypothetical protein